MLILWHLRKSESSFAHDVGRNGDNGGNGHARGGNGSGNSKGNGPNSSGVRESVGRGAKGGKPEPVAIYTLQVISMNYIWIKWEVDNFFT